MSDENGEVFNVGNDEGETSIRRLADLVKQCAGDAQLSIQFAQSEDPNYLKDNPQRRCHDQVAFALSLAPEGETGRGIEANLAVVPGPCRRCVRVCRG
jgi:nucleoside-diphosphate-sugar epimerase